jgi:hypothetical protein
VASETTAWRAVAGVDEAHLVRLRAVRAGTRERAWGLGPDFAAGLTIDRDATIITGHGPLATPSPEPGLTSGTFLANWILSRFG